MPKIKVPRKSISLDMTAMCDMAFLLLTFFMLTTKFKAQEPIAVDMPSSISEIKLPDKDMLTISVDKKGGVFFGVDDQNTRRLLLEKMAQKYNINFTPSEIQEFSLIPTFGASVAALKGILNLSNADRGKLVQPGIPTDSTHNELKDWVQLARLSNPKLRIAVKGDRDVDYDVVKNVIATLQDQNINKFNLITSLEAKPE